MQFKHRALSGLALLAALSATAHAATFQGKLWLLSNSNLNTTFPVPAATPDATFTAHHLSFFVCAPGFKSAFPDVRNSVSGLLQGVTNLSFSGLVNPTLGTVVTSTTPVVNSNVNGSGTYGVYVEFTGMVHLVKGELVAVTHDDGVSLMIDGTLVPGVASGPGPAVTQEFQFTGETGLHLIDLVYANWQAIGLLSFSPAM